VKNECLTNDSEEFRLFRKRIISDIQLERGGGWIVKDRGMASKTWNPPILNIKNLERQLVKTKILPLIKKPGSPFFLKTYHLNEYLYPLYKEFERKLIKCLLSP
jgi:hypothetical protein